MRASYVAVLRTRHARPLVLAATLGRLSFGMGPLALVLHVQAATGSFARAGAASAATALSNGLSAPLRGRLVDRYGQRRTLLPCAVVYAASLDAVVALARPGAAGAVLTVALAGLAGAAVPPLVPSMRVLWTSLVGRGPALQTAYALDSVLDEATSTVGPLAAGGLAVADPAVGLAVAAGLGVVGTAAFTASPVSRAWSGDAVRPAGWAGAMAGPGIRTLVATLVGVGAALGIWEIGLVAAARADGSAAAGGVLLALLSAGSAVGGLLYGARSWRRPTGQRFVILLALLWLACAPLALAPGLVALGVLAGVMGLVLAPAASSSYVLAAELAPAGTMTESTTWTTTANNVTAAAGIAAAGVMVDRVGVPWTLGTAWICVTVALLVAVAGRSRLVPGAAGWVGWRQRGRHERGRAGQAR
jgi:MFS family permease